MRGSTMLLLMLLSFSIVAASEAQTGPDDPSLLPEGVRTRWATAENPGGEAGRGGTALGGRKGAPCISPLKAGATVVLARVEGTSGRVRRIWLTPHDRSAVFVRGLRFRCTWDGAGAPAIDVPLGDFFCHGLGKMTAFENAWFSDPEGRSFNCVLPMPFRTGMRIEVINESGKDLPSLFYEVDYTIGDKIPADAGYLHAHWRREERGVAGQDYTILPEVTGRGRLLGACFSVVPNTAGYGRAWWGEGEVKGYVDDDGDHPTLCGTGTEDYIGTGWGQGRYGHRWQGSTIADGDAFRYAFYRLHGPDPIHFERRMRLTIQRIGCMHPPEMPAIRASKASFKAIGAPVDLERPETWRVGMFEREGDDWASCVWFYLDRPENGLPPLAPVASRLAGL